MTLRPYQSAIRDELRNHMKHGVRRILLQLATGGGKTIIVAHMTRAAEERGKTTWLVVHRAELVDQTIGALAMVGCNVGVVAAGHPRQPGLRVQVCSVQSLVRRFEKLPSPDLIIWDEAHHCAAGTWSKIADHYPSAWHIGLTATPERLDGKGLYKYFSKIVSGPTPAWLIEHGYLSKYKIFAPPSVSMDGVRTIAGDYNRKDVAARLDGSTVIGDALEHYQRHCAGTRAVVFAWSVEASKYIAEQFQDAGIAAAHLDGTTPRADRRRIIADFRAGRIKVLSNVEIVSEGFDLPAVESAFLLRPTQSLGLHLQQVGRVLRPAPGKEYAVIFDHAGNAMRHGLPDDEREWSLEGRKKKNQDMEPGVKTCGECFAVCHLAARECPECGYVFPVVRREVTEIDGDLVEIDPQELRRQREREQGFARTVEELIAIGLRRGYKHPSGWARNVIRGRERK